MKASELRIGNYVQSKFYSDPLQIEMVDLCDVVGFQDNGILDITYIEPILLTEEMLLATGAKQKSGVDFEIERFKLSFLFAYGYWYVTDIPTKTYLTKIEFVHEWQNFYYVMQGKELKIEL
jgi:hypothetical protein